MSATKSILKTRLAAQGTLRPPHQRIVEELESDTTYIEKRRVIAAAGDEVTTLHVLRSGWAVARFGEPTGRSAITRLYLPGDIIGLTEMTACAHPYTVSMISDGSVARISKAQMLRLSHAEPGLTGRLAHFDQLDSIAAQERLFAIGRLSAADRIKHFFLTLQVRLATTMAITRDRFPFYMQMNELGDINGLSAVTISNVIGKMRDDGEITLCNASVELHRRAAWVEELGFVNRYAPRPRAAAAA